MTNVKSDVEVDLFWPDLYYALFPDVLDAKEDAYRHYQRWGRRENRSPHPLLCTSFVKPMQPRTPKGQIPGLLASFLQGLAHGPFHSLVDIAYMQSQDASLVTAQDCFRAIADPDKALSIRPHPLFDPAFYRLTVEHLRFENELIDYLMVNQRTGRPHALFDGEYYIATGGVVDNPNEGTLLSYLKHWRLWRGDVSPLVDVRFLNHQLMRLAPDFAVSGQDPLTYALLNRLDCKCPLIHPHVDSRVIEGCFGSILVDHADAPEAVQAAEIIKYGVMPRPRAASAPWVSAIILNYGKHVYTFFSIAATLCAFRDHAAEIIMVENGGEPIYFEYILKYFRFNRNVAFVKPRKNKFYGEGNNIGMDQASGEYLLLLNNDCFLIDTYGAALEAHLATHPDRHVVGALLYYPDMSVQEFGGLVSDCGQIIQRAKHLPQAYMAAHTDVESVDYASAACLVISRQAMDHVAGFDLLFEPFYYEDTDLCRRLKKAGFGVVVSPHLTAMHIENASTLESLGRERFQMMVADHRAVFARRWFKERGVGAYATPSGTSRVAAEMTARSSPDGASGRPVAVIYTPFDIKTGGGERYLLATARVLSTRYSVIICAGDYLSRARVLHVLLALCIPEFDFRICNDIGSIRSMARTVELFFVMGNEIIPPAAPLARLNIFHLQFPFPWRDLPSCNLRLVEEFDAVVVNSGFTRYWTSYRMTEAGVRKPPPILELSPPVRQIARRVHDKAAPPQPGISIITVGRFFVGGHSKRQDVFLKILETAREQTGVPIRATMIGAVHDTADAQAYYQSIVSSAALMKDVEIIVDAPVEILDEALHTADVYLHCAGYGLSETESPEKMEHFGISIVEAIQAGCIPLVYDCGGAKQVVAQANVGYTFKNVDIAAQRLVRLCSLPARRKALENVDVAWVENVLEPAFADNLFKIVDGLERKLEVSLPNARL